MTRSLFARLAATHLSVALVSLVTLALVLGGLLQSFVFREKERTLIRYGREVNRLIVAPGFGFERRRAALQLEAMDRLVEARIWIVAPDGTVVADSHGDAARQGLRLAPEEMRRILAGETVVRRGVFRGRFEAPVISVGLPLLTAEGPAGAIFLHSPVVGVRAGLLPLLRLLAFSGLAAAALALGLSLGLSRRLASPLHDMSEAAQDLARGRFDRRVRLPAADDEVRRLAVSFNDMAARLGDLERLRREFIADVSHELRSPLTSMRGFLQGILDGTVPEAEREHYLGLAFDETRRLSRLVNDLLDLAALESGDVTFEPDDLDPREVLERAAAKMAPQAAARGLVLRVEPPGGDVPAVRADPDRLEQVLINLLDNAIRFTPEGGTVTLSARPAGEEAEEPGRGTAGAAGAVEIAVRDTGPGIPPEDLGRIWERFYKGDRARTRSKGGTGLGLAIARALVERQGGSIRAESRPGEGTAFFVTLPAAGVPA